MVTEGETSWEGQGGRVNLQHPTEHFFLRAVLSLGALNIVQVPPGSPALKIILTKSLWIALLLWFIDGHKDLDTYWPIALPFSEMGVARCVILYANNVSDSLSRVYFLSLTQNYGLCVPALTYCPHLEHSKILSCFCIGSFYNYLIPWGLQSCSLQPVWVTS